MSGPGKVRSVLATVLLASGALLTPPVRDQPGARLGAADGTMLLMAGSLVRSTPSPSSTATAVAPGAPLPTYYLVAMDSRDVPSTARIKKVTWAAVRRYFPANLYQPRTFTGRWRQPGPARMLIDRHRRR
jgi:hypothetical protein